MVNDKNLELSYASLNVWRKVYLSLMWFISACLVLGGVAKLIENPSGFPLTLMVLLVFFLAFTYWTHFAIVKRKIMQLKLLAALNIVPLANIIGCLIMLSIIRVSKKELDNESIKRGNL